MGMLEYWNDGKVEHLAQFPSVPSFQYSYVPHADGFVISVEAGKLFVRRPLVRQRSHSCCEGNAK